MASLKQIAANRRNSLLSTGPVTEAGKLASSWNARKHGLTGHIVVRQMHQIEAFDAFHASMLPTLAPANPFERDLADRIIHDCWLLNGAGAMTENLLYNGAYENQHGAMPSSDSFEEGSALAEARAFRANAPAFNLLSLYRQRLERSFHKNLALLKSLQKDRAKQPAISFQQNAEALKDALQHHAATAAASPQSVDSPTPFPEIGFVYSTASADPDPPPPTAPNDPETMAA